MKFFSTAKPKLDFKALSQISDASQFKKYLELVTGWFTEEWGYIHDKNITQEEALQARLDYLTENADKIYLAFYDKVVVGAFRTGNREYDKELVDSQVKKGLKEELQIKEIWFLYVDKSFRDLGIGRKIVDEIKRQSKVEMCSGMILLETLKPGLNRFYTIQGARFIGENTMDSNPTDVLTIKF